MVIDRMKKIITFIFILLFSFVVTISAMVINKQKKYTNEPTTTIEIADLVNDSDTIVFKLRGEPKMRLTIKR